MIDLEGRLLRRYSGLAIVAGSVALGLAGWLPLLLYVWFGPADGNPIGLGLLAMATVPFAAVGVLAGLVKMLVEYFGTGNR